jgi:hypothetical protein
MDTLLRLFTHDAELQIIVCRSCAIAVPLTHLARHLKERHPKAPLTEQVNVAAAAYAVNSLAWQPADVRILTPAKKQVLNLKYSEDRLLCAEVKCWYMCTAVQTMQEHCKQKHSWENYQKQGGDMKQKRVHTSN